MKQNESLMIFDALRPELTTDRADLSPVHFITQPEPEVTLDSEEVQL